MKKELTPLKKATLRSVLSEFPTYEWSDMELEELVSPKHGVISGFEKISEDTRKLIETDLKEIEPAGELPYDKEYQ